MAKIRICIEPGCKNTQTTKDFCRLHYLRNWKTIKHEDQKKAADRLNKYVEGICKKNPERYMDVIRRDIRNGKMDRSDFLDEYSESGNSEEIFESAGFQDDATVDKLLSHIKLDKDY